MIWHKGGCHCGKVRCLDEGTVAGMVFRKIDGKNWEKHYPEGRGTY